MSFVLETYDSGETYTNQKKFKCGIGAIDRYAWGIDKRQDQVAGNLILVFVLVETQHNDQLEGITPCRPMLCLDRILRILRILRN